MKKILCAIIVILLACFMTVSVFATSESSKEMEFKSKLLRENCANQQYQTLLAHINDTAQSNNRSNTIDYYGGAYINESGNLVVCVTQDYDANSNAIELYTNNDNIEVKNVEYTLNEILEEQERITNMIDENRHSLNNIETISNLLESITSTYTDEENNKLVIHIKNLNSQISNDFYKFISNKDFIELIEGHNTVTTADWKPGRKIYVNSSTYASTGYPVYFYENNTLCYGFVTAGHAYDVGDTVYSTTRTSLGTCVKSKFSGNTDAALIKITNSSYSISPTTYYGGITLSRTSFVIPAQGTSIYKEGATTGRTSGTVTSTNGTAYYNEATISDLIIATTLNLGGDSGGVAYTYDNKIIGSMSGSSYASSEHNANTFTHCYITKYANVRDDLGGRIWM